MKTKTTIGLLACAAFFAVNVSAQTHKLSDPEIASVAVVANQIDIGYAEIAKQKSKNSEVTKVADMMIRDHKSVIDQATALVKKLNVTPKDNDVSRKLSSDADKMKATLNSKSDKDFDKAYIDNEVSYHKAVIKEVEKELIPQASNGELKALLEKALPIFKEHLEHVERVQKSMKG